jgi:dienelactone hydrolase/ectoine hydroxylase-related dioxygenase (phytanoyl-CoA dioxygenase family)
VQNSRLTRRNAHDAELRREAAGHTDHVITAQAIRAAVARLAHVGPQSPPPRLEVMGSTVTRHDGIQAEHCEFRSTARDGIRAVVLIPDGAVERHPAVLVSPGRRAVLGQVTGTEPPDFPDRNIAERLARAGLVTLTLDYGLDGMFPAELLRGRDAAAVLAEAFSLGRQPLLGALVEDNLDALDWLRGHPGVDPDRIGLFGHSLGGAVALHTALVADQLLPLCVASHFGTYPVLHGQKLSGNPAAMLPGILRYADLPELFTALEPRPLQIQYGTEDPGLLPHDAAQAAAHIRTVWPRSSERQLEIHQLAMGHGTDTGRAVAFFQRILAPGGFARGARAPAITLTSNGRAIPLDDKFFAPLADSSELRSDPVALRDRLHRDGYLFLRGVLDREKILRLRAGYFSRLAPGFLKPGTEAAEGIYAGSVPEETPPYGVPGHPAHSFVRSEEFREFSADPALRGLAEAVLGGEVEILPRKIVRHFWSGSFRASRAHMDYDYMAEGSDRLVTSWIPIGDCPLPMGGLIYLEGTEPLSADQLALLRTVADRPDRRPISHDLRWIAEQLGRRWLWADYEAGDVTIHSPYTVHASVDTSTQAMRLSADLRFQRAGEEVDPRWTRHWSADDGA